MTLDPNEPHIPYGFIEIAGTTHISLQYCICPHHQTRKGTHSAHMIKLVTHLSNCSRDGNSVSAGTPTGTGMLKQKLLCLLTVPVVSAVWVFTVVLGALSWTQARRSATAG